MAANHRFLMEPGAMRLFAALFPRNALTPEQLIKAAVRLEI